MEYTMELARLNAKLTQREVADRMHICRDKYRKLEKNPEKVTIEEALSFCSIVGLPLDEVIFSSDNSTLSRVKLKYA
jgi:DNA-binding XRE family transcriptional regulator|nr:MAG TPA: hypothetical protein [Caudoviricetes sp.]